MAQILRMNPNVNMRNVRAIILDDASNLFKEESVNVPYLINKIRESVMDFSKFC